MVEVLCFTCRRAKDRSVQKSMSSFLKLPLKQAAGRCYTLRGQLKSMRNPLKIDGKPCEMDVKSMKTPCKAMKNRVETRG